MLLCLLFLLCLVVSKASNITGVCVCACNSMYSLGCPTPSVLAASRPLERSEAAWRKGERAGAREGEDAAAEAATWDASASAGSGPRQASNK